MSYKLALIGEAYGEAEENTGQPFVGPAGKELDRMLADADILRGECFLSNVFNLRPPRNDITQFCGPRKDPNIVPKLPPLALGKYLLSEFYPEVLRLYKELEEIRPNLVVCLGNTAAWALLGSSGISKIRGTCSHSSVIPGLKILPTYHPAAVLKQYDLRHVTVLDLIKAKRESEFSELRRPVREIWTEPDLEDLEIFYERYLQNATEISFDVETAFEQITCISFAPTPEVCLVIPIIDYRRPGSHYWKTLEKEVQAWSFIQRVLQTPAKKSGQNILYDIQYLWRQYGITVSNLADDTMLLHHALQPESQKSLGFLGSLYTNEIAWKPMRPRGKHTEKREDE